MVRLAALAVAGWCRCTELVSRGLVADGLKADGIAFEDAKSCFFNVFQVLIKLDVPEGLDRVTGNV